MGITMDIERITPSIASEYLRKNTPFNRSIRSKRVETYADEMRRGGWKLNGESICFNKKGELVDGQHRLLAIIKAGVPIETTVIRGIENDVVLFDRGGNRTETQILRMRNDVVFKPSNSIIASIKLYLTITYGINSARVWSSAAIVEFINTFASTLQEVHEITEVSSSKYTSTQVNTKKACIQTAVMGALMKGEEPEKLARFFEIFRTGIYKTDKEMSAIVLRNDFLGGKIIYAGSSGRSNHAITAERCVERAIFDFCKGRVRKLSYNSCTEPIYVINKEPNTNKAN